MDQTSSAQGPDQDDDAPEVQTYSFVIKPAHGLKRLDQHLASRFPAHSRTFMKRLIEEGAVTVNGAPAKPSCTPRPGDELVAHVPVTFVERVEPEEIPLDIIYEDEWILVVNKPPDMVVHPAKGHLSGTLVNAVAWHCKQLSRRGGELRAGIVHRLDRDTTGVILLVKNESVHESLSRQFEQRSIKKQYLAICEGCPELDSDVIDAPIGPHSRHVEMMAVRHDVGRAARTVYEVVERLGDFSIVRCFPESGRTHQIRVHLRHIGHPVVCDAAYGRREAICPADLTGSEPAPSEAPLLARQALHARRLRIRHPALGREMEFEAPVPRDMMALVDALRARQQRTGGSPAGRPNGR